MTKTPLMAVLGERGKGLFSGAVERLQEHSWGIWWHPLDRWHHGDSLGLPGPSPAPVLSRVPMEARSTPDQWWGAAAIKLLLTQEANQTPVSIPGHHFSTAISQQSLLAPFPQLPDEGKIRTPPWSAYTWECGTDCITSARTACFQNTPLVWTTTTIRWVLW